MSSSRAPDGAAQRPSQQQRQQQQQQQPGPRRQQSRRALPHVLLAASDEYSSSSSSTSPRRHAGRARSSDFNLSSSGATSITSTSSSSPSAAHPRSSVTRVACDACRRRRTKCSGERPNCAACVNYRSECHYSSATPSETNSQALKRRYDEVRRERDLYRDLYDCLCTVPDVRAFDMLRQIRARTASPAAILSSQAHEQHPGDEAGAGADASPRPPPRASTSLTVVPGLDVQQLCYEFPYRAAMPRAIERSPSVYLDSVLYQIVHAVYQHRGAESERRDQWERQLKTLAVQHPPAYLRPYHTARHIDSRLRLVDVSRWTSVISDSALFASLVSSYLVYEHPSSPVLQQDILLEAMVSGDERFCSPLLVNALLAKATHCCLDVPDRRKYWDPSNLSYAFLAEGRRLWELDGHKDDLVTAEAAVLLYITYTHDGLDIISHRYLERALAICVALDLFRARPPTMDPKMGQAMDFLAWSIYRWSAVYSYYFQTAPLIKTIPEIVLPDPEKNPTWYGDFYLLYPLSDTPFSTYHGLLFRAVSDLRVIVCDIGQTVFSKGGPPALPAEKYMSLLGRMEAWFESLPGPLTPKHIIWPAQMTMHMEYFIVVSTMSRMSIVEDAASPSCTPSQRRRNLEAARRRASDTLSLALVHLETLARLYYLRHSYSHYDPHLTQVFSTLARYMSMSRGINSTTANTDTNPNMASTSSTDTSGSTGVTATSTTPGSNATVTGQEEDAEEHIRSTLVLCFKGLSDQGCHNNLAAVVCRLLLERQAPDVVRLVSPYIRPDVVADEDAIGRAVRSAYPLYMSGAGDDPDDARLENILKR